jgi:hypothetical protein
LVLVLVEVVWKYLENYLTQDGEVLYQLFHIRREILPAGGAGENVAGPQVHEAVLAEGVTTLKDPGDLILVVVVVVTYGARDVHVDECATNCNFRI